jgi:hypothetical protein
VTGVNPVATGAEVGCVDGDWAWEVG